MIGRGRPFPIRCGSGWCRRSCGTFMSGSVRPVSSASSGTRAAPRSAPLFAIPRSVSTTCSAPRSRCVRNPSALRWPRRLTTAGSSSALSCWLRPSWGRTGEVIQATLRARHELEREQAEAPTRLARASNDADLQQNLTLSNEDAWRYRETDLWGELVQRTQALQIAVRGAGPGVVGISTRTGLRSLRPEPTPAAQP